MKVGVPVPRRVLGCKIYGDDNQKIADIFWRSNCETSLWSGGVGGKNEDEEEVQEDYDILLVR